jgi:spermidine synthase
MVKKRLSFELLLLFSVFIIATCGLVYELVAGALASYLLGDSVKQFSFIIGIYLFSMGVGSYFAKFLNNNLLDKFIEIEILVGLIGGLSSIVLFLIFDYGAQFQFVLYLLVFLTGCLVGMEIPLLMNILENRIEFKELVSNVFTFDYIGALLASVLFPLVLVPQLGLIRTSLFFGLINISIAIALCYFLKKEVKNLNGLRLRAFFVFFILLIAFIFSDKILAYSEGKLYGENVIYSKTTPYQRIVLTRSKNDFRLYLNNNLQFSSRDEYRYHESLVHPALSLSKKINRVLVLGGGDGLAVREILKYPEVEEITLVDLDEGMTNLFKTNELLNELNKKSLSHQKVKIINADAYVWLKNYQGEAFDAAIIDFPDPSNYSVGKLYTLNFYETLKKTLAPDAVFTIQTTSPYFASKSFWCIQKTVSQVFQTTLPYHAFVPSFGEWGFLLVAVSPMMDLKKEVFHKVENLKFYNYTISQLAYFQQDMQQSQVEINRLDNQILVRYFDEEWSRY